MAAGAEVSADAAFAVRTVNDPALRVAGAEASQRERSGIWRHGRFACAASVVAAAPLRRLVLVTVVAAALGCGNALYAIRISQASDAMARAEQLEAPVRAPYEYHFALEHLRKARSEAAEADFGDAERLAATALDYANRAVRLAQRVEPAPAGGTP